MLSKLANSGVAAPSRRRVLRRLDESFAFVPTLDLGLHFELYFYTLIGSQVKEGVE